MGKNKQTVAELRELSAWILQNDDARDTDYALVNRAADALEAAESLVAHLKVARSNHPKCDVHDDDDVITCGWKRAVLDIDAALTLATA